MVIFFVTTRTQEEIKLITLAEILKYLIVITRKWQLDIIFHEHVQYNTIPLSESFLGQRERDSQMF